MTTRVLAVGSGKGGVGKSTVSWYLAHSLSHAGLRVGLLDADIYGPSLPYFLQKHEPPTIENHQIIPVMHQGLACMSIGFLIPSEQAAVWRGPMIMKAVKQMIHDVKWDVEGSLDCLVVDLPPGTGDVPLTLSQEVKLDGALVVTTPHVLAMDDAKRAETMFERLNIPVVGVLQNMSTLACTSCGHEHAIFESENYLLKNRVIGSLPFLLPKDHHQWLERMSSVAQNIMAHLW